MNGTRFYPRMTGADMPDEISPRDKAISWLERRYNSARVIDTISIPSSIAHRIIYNEEPRTNNDL